MARFFTMLTFALIAATQTAQAFPHYTNWHGFKQQAPVSYTHLTLPTKA